MGHEEDFLEFLEKFLESFWNLRKFESQVYQFFTISVTLFNTPPPSPILRMFSFTGECKKQLFGDAELLCARCINCFRRAKNFFSAICLLMVHGVS